MQRRFTARRLIAQEEIEELIREAGMELLAVYDAYTMADRQPTDSERLFFIAREKGKA